jgi:zinc transport system permease protein
MEPFIIKALLAGIGIAALSGPLGSIIVWRRMAYFGDSLAHSSLLGVALGLALSISLNISMMITCIGFALLIVFLQQKRLLAVDTLLGIFSHAALSIGLVAISIMEVKVDTFSYLFGDILTVSNTDLYWIVAVLAVTMTIIYFIWNKLVLATISIDIAKAEGINTTLINIIFMLLIAFVIAASARILGALLITSLMLIPAASARQIANSPKQMAVIASILGITSVIAGIYFSYDMDTPSGPTIIVTASAVFIVMMVYGLVKQAAQRKH